MDEFKITSDEIGNAKYKTNKGVTVALFVVFLFVIVLTPFFCYQCTRKSSFNITDLNFTYDYGLLHYTAYVNGVLHNNSKSNYRYVSVEYNIYDYSGNILGTAYDNISNLQAGDKWGFSAVLFTAEAQPYRCQLIKIISW